MTRRIPLFPLPGVVLLPGTLLPLHIFEPRYRQMVANALSGDRMIGMALLRGGVESDAGESPIYAGGRLYFFDQNGTAHVLRPGRQFNEIAVNHLDAGCMASPAAVGKALIVRTKTHLYRIEEQSPPK